MLVLRLTLSFVAIESLNTTQKPTIETIEIGADRDKSNVAIFEEINLEPSGDQTPVKLLDLVSLFAFE